MAYGKTDDSPVREDTNPPIEPAQDELSAQDQARLDALEAYGILDTDAETAFDEIVFIAKTVTGAPTALISLVEEDRQWFKARIGLDVQETPINQSVCAHGMASTDMLIIDDLTADNRTAANPLVTAQDGIRFYAGAPLVTPDDVVIGMLCVLDVKPRTGGLDPTQRRIMTALAHQAVNQLELRKSLRASAQELERHRSQTEMLKRTSKRLRLAEEAGSVGAFELEIERGIVRVSPEFCRIVGIPHVETIPAAQLSALRKEANLVPIEESDTLSEDGYLNDEFEILRQNDSATRWLDLRARFVGGADGEPDVLVGIITDVTDQHMVNEEIGHRLKNTLALVQAVAGHTLRDLPDAVPVQEFNRRISALATAHDLLMRRARSSGCMAELAHGVFTKLGIETRVAITGRDFELGSRSLLTLSMILHELGTNAIKYGALSLPDGTVTLETRFYAGEDDEECVEMTWTESGGPPVEEPSRKGLGTRLVERGIEPEGSVDISFAATGLVVQIRGMLRKLKK